MIANLTRGMSDAVRGARYLSRRPRLWSLVVAPAVLTLLALAGVAWGVLSVADPVMSWVVDVLPDAVAGWIGGLLRLLLLLVLAFAGYVVFVSVAAVLSAPFNEMLSERIEQAEAGAEPPAFALGGFARDVARGLAHALRRVLAYVVTLAVLFLIGVLVPVVGPVIYGVGGAIATARFAAYDAMDAVWARKSWSYAAKMAYLKTHRGRTYGLGAAIALMLAVPVLNVLALSIGAAGATLLHLDAAQNRERG